MNNDVNTLIHDLNNKLAIVKMSVEVLVNCLVEKKLNSDPIPRYLEILKRNIIDAQDLCQSQMEESGPEGSAEFIQDVLKESLDQYSNLKIKIEVHTINKCRIKANKMEFKRAFINLLKNSMEAGATIMHVEFRKDSITLFDNGGGVSEYILSKILNQIPITSKVDGHGIGLGSLFNFCQKQDLSCMFSNNDYHPVDGKRGLKVVISNKKLHQKY